MGVSQWNEAGKIWLDDHGLLDEKQASQLRRADEPGQVRSPIPTRVVSNGEYMPPPQSEHQRRVEARIGELAETASKKLGMSRRRFLAGAGGSAAAFVAMNEVFGRFFNVDPVEMFEPLAAQEASPPRDMFVFDDQLHVVRGTMGDAGHALRAIAQGPTASSPDITENPFNQRGMPDERGETWGAWNPELIGLPNSPENYQLVQFIKDIYLDSQVTVGLLSNVTASVVDDGRNVRAPRNAREAMEGEVLTAAQTAADWPDLNFITYHAAIQPAFFMHDSLQEIQSGRLREGVPDISWTTEYATLVAPFSNVYAEIGTTWASTIVSFPTVAAHLMGQLMKFMGPDRIVFGSDSVWYGTPQWQIEALWRFQIPEEMRERWGYPEITEADKRKILGLNSAKLYGIEGVESGGLTERFRDVPADYEQRMSTELRTLFEFPGYTADNMARFKSSYAALALPPNHDRYGWVRPG